MVEAARGGEHLRKPDAFLEMLEAYFPTLPKIGFNARRVRSGMLADYQPSIDAGEARTDLRAFPITLLECPRRVIALVP
jgi:hypothetical protein